MNNNILKLVYDLSNIIDDDAKAMKIADYYARMAEKAEEEHILSNNPPVEETKSENK